MALQELKPPLDGRHEFNTSDAVEHGDNPRGLITKLNAMLTELYGFETARLAVEATGSPLKFVDITITSAQLLALNATPQTIVAAPGAGLALIFHGILASKAAGTAYAGIAAGEDLAVKYTDAAGAVQATIEPVGFLDQATAQSRYAAAYAAASGVNSMTPANTPLVLHMLTGEITTGDSDLKLRVYYRTVPTVL